MNTYNYSNKQEKVKDNDKGHKIAASLYLVTNHLSDNDPLKSALRTHAVNLVSFAFEEKIASLAHHVHALLETAVLAGLISEKNASIISLELRHHVINMTTEPDTLSTLFAPTFAVPETKHSLPRNMSYTARPQPVSHATAPSVKAPIINENKSKRQEVILSFIREHKSAAIKDISALFTDTSEKTIQRELGALVSAGKITKRGEKRWSVYMVI